MNYKIQDVIDIDKIDALLESFSEVTDIALGMLDLDGKILSGTGWAKICTEFHRVCPQTAARCTKSDTFLAGQLKKGEKFNVYKCLNGLIDVAAPIVIGGKHVGNLFTGQFLFETPDTEFFRKQAKEFGFDEDSYLESLSHVRIISKSKIDIIIEFMLKLTNLFGEMGLRRVRELEATEDLRKSRESYRAVVENTPALICNFLPDGKITYVNNAYCEYFGKTPRELIGSPFLSLIPEADHSAIMANISKMIPEVPNHSHEHRMIGPGDDIRWQRWANRAIFDDQGQPVAYQAIGQDITDRKKTEKEIISQARFTSENPNPVMRISGQCEILHTNRAADWLLENLREQQIRGLPEGWNELVDNSLTSEKLQHTECVCGKRVFSLTFAPVADSEYVNVYAHDITKRKNTELEVLEHQKKLRSLAIQLAKAEERQRRKIASGLHDNVVQNLAAVKISASMLRDSTESEEFRNEIEGMLRILDDTIYETRTLTFELCPPILHNLGFDPAAEWLVEEFGKQNKITTKFESLTGSSSCDMPEDIRDLLFQLLREILTNVAKHAEASNVKISTSGYSGKYVISVEDNGRGFDVSSVMSRSDGMEGFGLFNVRERLGHFEGHLDIDSKQGEGTKVTISLPNQNDGDAA